MKVCPYETSTFRQEHGLETGAMLIRDVQCVGEMLGPLHLHTQQAVMTYLQLRGNTRTTDAHAVCNILKYQVREVQTPPCHIVQVHYRSPGVFQQERNRM